MMPGVQNTGGYHAAGPGRYEDPYTSSRHPDPYSRGPGEDPHRYSRDRPPEDPYSRGREPAGYDPYSARSVQTLQEPQYAYPPSSHSRDQYVRRLPADPYRDQGRGDPYTSRDDLYRKAERAPNGTGPPRDEYGTRAPPPSDRPGANGPVFDLDHLATFTVSSKQGVINPQDGMKKLRSMEHTTGIWTMRVSLVVETRDIVIYDKGTEEEMERFPVNLVTDPTAVANSDRREIYNNIALFTVQEDVYRKSPTEVHIFQCISNPAQDIVNAIKDVKSGRSSYRSSPRDEPPPRVHDAIQRYEQASRTNMGAVAAYQPGPVGPRQAFRQSMRADDAESVLSERTDRDVDLDKHSNQMLNHCFDDIEKFVGRLQQAAESFKELDRRRMTRDKHRHGPGDGMLSMRARPPPAKDFIDIFQKLKLSFNLLAKLKPHIHDPNAPELVHFLFTPLSLVVEASKDPRHGTPDLAAKVVSPLLTPDAKDLLLNCLTSRETDLWMSLGSSWTVSRDQWKGYVPPYFPRFSDGWQPSHAWLDEERATDISDSVRKQQEQIRQRNDAERAAKEAQSHVMSYPPRSSERPYNDTVYRDQQDPYRAPYEDPYRNHVAQRGDIPQDRTSSQPPSSYHPPPQSRDPFEAEQQDYLRELRARGAKVSEALHDREGKNEKEMSLKKGEIVEVLDDTRNWWKLINSRGVTGFAPYTILQEVGGSGYDPDLGSPPGSLPHSPNQSSQPSRVPSHSQQDWAAQQDRPQTRPTAARPPPPTTAPPVAEHRISREADYDMDQTSSKSGSSYHEQGNRRSTQDDLHDELKLRMSMGKQAGMGGKRTRPPATSINQHSTPSEVHDWLAAKSFSAWTQQALSSKNGQELFEMSRARLENLCGKDEGARLDSQLNVQKNICGYQEGKSEELEFILQQRKKASDSKTNGGMPDNIGADNVFLYE